jgi:hypothetical protein
MAINLVKSTNQEWERSADEINKPQMPDAGARSFVNLVVIKDGERRLTPALITEAPQDGMTDEELDAFNDYIGDIESDFDPEEDDTPMDWD